MGKLGLSTEEQARIFDQILDGDRKALARIKSGRTEIDGILFPLLNLKGQSAGFLKNLKALSAQSLPEFEPYLDNFIAIVDILEALGCSYQIDIASGAGFEYYTGVIFQFFIGGEKIGGGGRYDALIPTMGGGDIPASGFALYLDRLMTHLEPEILAKPKAQVILVRVEKGEAFKKAFGAANRLREAGYVADFDLNGQKRADLRWILDVWNEKPFFVLRDELKSSQAEIQSIEEVLALLERESANKDSFT